MAHRLLDRPSGFKYYLPNHGQCAGQAFIVVLLFLAIGSLLFVSSYSIGQVLLAQLHLSQSTDAAAYAAAVVQARSLNAHAYLNRSQLAHQLAMAHWVTLGSSVKFTAAQAGRSIQRNPPPWLIGTMFGTQFASSYLSSKIMTSPEGILHVVQQQHKNHDLHIHQYIASSRQTLIDIVDETRREVIEDVLLRNLSPKRAISNQATLSSIDVAYEIVSDEFRDRVRISSTRDRVWSDVLRTVSNMYGYLNNRNTTKVNWWWPNLKCPFFRPKLRRLGNTYLDENGLWQAQDTLSYHAIKFNRLIGCYEREYPMGWGLVQEVQSNMKGSTTVTAPWDFSKIPFWRWFKSVVQLDGISWFSSKNSLADAWAEQSSRRLNAVGFAQFARLDFTDRRSMSFRLIVKQRGFSVLGIPFELSAQSKGEAYFEPPNLSKFGGHDASPHLYHAFWHPKLSTH